MPFAPNAAPTLTKTTTEPYAFAAAPEKTSTPQDLSGFELHQTSGSLPFGARNHASDPFGFKLRAQRKPQDWSGFNISFCAGIFSLHSQSMKNKRLPRRRSPKLVPRKRKICPIQTSKRKKQKTTDRPLFKGLQGEQKISKRKLSQHQAETKRPRIDPVPQSITAIPASAIKLQDITNEMPLAISSNSFIFTYTITYCDAIVPALSSHCVPQAVNASKILQLFRRWTARVRFKRRGHHHNQSTILNPSKKPRVAPPTTTATPTQQLQGCTIAP